MSLPEIARGRVKPIIHSFCYNRQTGDLVLQADQPADVAVCAAQ